MNEPTNQPTNQNPISEILRKAIGAERTWIVAYLRRHQAEPIEQLAAAIAAGDHMRWVA